MYYDLNKKDKKIARACIDKGLEIEYKTGLQKAKEIINEWESGKLNKQAAYVALYEKVYEQDKRISRRYDRLGGSRYLETVIAIFYEGQITEEDIKDFSEEVKNIITTVATRRKRIKEG